MRPGVRLAVDVGTVRVGLARSDAGAVLALPLQTLTRQDDASELDEIARIAGELNAIEIVVGLPRHMQGGEGISAKGAGTRERLKWLYLRVVCAWSMNA